MKAWLASDLSELDLLVVQIDGLHVGDHVPKGALCRFLRCYWRRPWRKARCAVDPAGGSETNAWASPRCRTTRLTSSTFILRSAAEVPLHRALPSVRKPDLSHSYASRALALAESLTMIGRLLGHSKGRHHRPLCESRARRPRRPPPPAPATASAPISCRKPPRRRKAGRYGDTAIQGALQPHGGGAERRARHRVLGP